MNISFKEITKYSNATYAAVRAENGNVIRISGGVRLATKLEKAWKDCKTFSEYIQEGYGVHVIQMFLTSFFLYKKKLILHIVLGSDCC